MQACRCLSASKKPKDLRILVFLKDPDVTLNPPGHNLLQGTFCWREGWRRATAMGHGERLLLAH